MLAFWSTYFLIGALILLNDAMDEPEHLQEHRWELVLGVLILWPALLVMAIYRDWKEKGE